MESQRRLSMNSGVFEDAENSIQACEFERTSLSFAENKAVKEYLLFMIKKYCMKTPVFVGVKGDEEILEILEELETWEPPEYLKKNFPFYYTGRDADGRPIWIVEAGKFDIKALANQRPDVLGAIDKAIMQMLQVAVKSMVCGGIQSELKGVHGIADLDGMTFGKLASPAAMAMIVTYAKRYKDLAEFLLSGGVVINANYVVEFMVNRLRPLISKVLKKVKIYGKDEAIWRPRLQRSFPDTTLPEIYGGSLSEPAYALEYTNLYQKFAFDSPMLRNDFIRV